MNELPLTKSQQALRGRDVRDLSIEQLHAWIDACTKMEHSVEFKKARRSWKRGREEALAELARRGITLPDLALGDT
jgi:hypothetical protein